MASNFNNERNFYLIFKETNMSDLWGTVRHDRKNKDSNKLRKFIKI